MTQIPNAPNPQPPTPNPHSPMLQCYQLPIVMSDDQLDTFCLREETVFLYQTTKKWHSRNKGIENRKYQDDQPHVQSHSHVHHYDNNSP